MRKDILDKTVMVVEIRGRSSIWESAGMASQKLWVRIPSAPRPGMARLGQNGWI